MRWVGRFRNRVCGGSRWAAARGWLRRGQRKRSEPLPLLSEEKALGLAGWQRRIHSKDRPMCPPMGR